MVYLVLAWLGGSSLPDCRSRRMPRNATRRSSRSLRVRSRSFLPAVVLGFKSTAPGPSTRLARSSSVVAEMSEKERKTKRNVGRHCIRVLIRTAPGPGGLIRSLY